VENDCLPICNISEYVITDPAAEKLKQNASYELPGIKLYRDIEKLVPFENDT
jgi:hypothetical protein